MFQSMLLSNYLPPAEKRRNRIAQEAFTIIVAGGETTARVLTTAIYHLLANRDIALNRLRDELNSTIVDPDVRIEVRTLEQLP